MIKGRDWPTFPIRGEILNILGFVGHILSMLHALLFFDNNV